MKYAYRFNFKKSIYEIYIKETGKVSTTENTMRSASRLTDIKNSQVKDVK